MPPVASSSQTHSPKDHSPKAKVNTSERTACFRKPSSSSFGVQEDHAACETETSKQGAFKQSRPTSEESENSRLSSSVNNNMEYKRLSSSNDSPDENSPSHVVNIPKTQEHKVNQCNPQHQTRLRQYIETYIDCSRKIIYSCVLLPLYAILIGFSAQASYMGVTYSNECPFLGDCASMFFLMGISGFGASFFQTLSVIQKHCFPDGSPYLSTTQMISFLLSMFYLGTFCIELHRFMSVEGLPSTIPGPNYCDAYFYGYVCWSSYSFSMLTLILFVVFAPPFFINVFVK